MAERVVVAKAVVATVVGAMAVLDDFVAAAEVTLVTMIVAVVTVVPVNSVAEAGCAAGNGPCCYALAGLARRGIGTLQLLWSHGSSDET